MPIIKVLFRKAGWRVKRLSTRIKLLFPKFKAYDLINHAVNYLDVRNHEKAISNIELALNIFPNQRSWVYALIIMLCVEQRKFSRAISLYRKFRQRFPDQATRFSELAIAATRLGDTRMALTLWEKVLPTPDLGFPLVWHTQKGIAYLGNDQKEQALKYFAFVQGATEDKEIFWPLISNYVEKLDTLQKILAVYEFLFKNLESTILSRVRYSKILIEAGKLEEAEAEFQELNTKYSSHPEILVGLAQVADKAREYTTAEKRWLELTKLWPDNYDYKYPYVQSLSNQLKYREAEIYMRENLKSDAPISFQLLQAEIYRSQASFENALAVLRKLHKKYPDNIVTGLRLVNLLLKFHKINGRNEFPLESLRVLLKLAKFHPHDTSISMQIIMCYLRVHQEEKALQHIEALPTSTNQKYLEIKAWMYAQKGDLDRAKRVWRRILEIHAVPQARPVESGVLHKKDMHSADISPDSHLLFTVVRNERWRLPWFFEYYRSIGVDRFFFVDNDSDDGTLEYLLEQPDTHVFWTNQTYAQGYSGMKWVNQLVEQFGENQWCIYVDVDEALIFPGIEHRPLSHLTSYMQEHGHEALTGFMCDMYADGDVLISNEEEYTNFMTDYPFFDNMYHFINTIYCPYIYTSGGVRGRTLGVYENQTKTPIIRGGKGIKFLMSSHQITPAVLSDVTCVLLHYKLSGNFRQVFEEDAKKNNRIPSCKQRYYAYSQALKTHEGKGFTPDKSTVKFSSSEQLVQLGLLKKPKMFM